MPLYEFECGTCGKRFERIQKFSDPPPDACPSCGGAVTKLPSSPAIQFKGSGWYITDYARKGSSDGSKGSGAKESKADDAKSESSKTDSAKKEASGSTPPAAKSD